MKVVQRNACEHYYLQIKLDFSSAPDHVISAQMFQSTIIQAIEQMFGECGSSIAIDLLKYNQNHREAVIRVPKKEFE
uniref:Ribonucleases P/MRP subunit Pop8-like domain-containing protein n=1 Tax=Strigamia maritima TaxID=126957 RepID=T1JKY8_STRMM